MDTETGRALGVFNAVVPVESFESEWPKWAAKFANASVSSVSGFKANVRDAMHMPFAEYLKIESARMVDSSYTQDHKNAVKAWLEARK